LFTIGGRANQILQNLTGKNFGNVILGSKSSELETLKNKWLGYLAGKPVDQFADADKPNAKIPEIANLIAVHALIISLQDNKDKDLITKNCLKKVYKLDDMPKDKSSSAQYCDPDTYTFSYLALLFGHENVAKDAKWWLTFWDNNHKNLVWNNKSGHYELGTR
jgi:hypothetical protein